MQHPSSTSYLRCGGKLTKVTQIDRVIDCAPVRTIIETVYTKGSIPMDRLSYDGLMLFKIELLCVWCDLSDAGGGDGERPYLLQPLRGAEPRGAHA